MPRLAVLVLPDVHLLDLGGPVQTFYEANEHGTDYRIAFCGIATEARSAQGLVLANLDPLPDLEPGDMVLVPGIESSTLDRLSHAPVAWLRAAHEAGALICSICTGAFVLGNAGLLDGRDCTTHWKLTDRLARQFPRARVADNRLFVRDGGIVTSAGVTAGVDMALALLEERHGPILTAAVAREMVVYLRRSGDRDQSSIYLDHRTHLHPGIHRVQDALVAHPERKLSIEQLAKIAAMSPRHLTRVFRRATGITPNAFAQRVRLQVARDLLLDPGLTLESISSRCGFSDARQLRRLFKQTFGTPPSAWRSEGRHADVH
jgi:transcriptional regulator GlxA family with amidase domain